MRGPVGCLGFCGSWFWGIIRHLGFLLFGWEIWKEGERLEKEGMGLWKRGFQFPAESAVKRRSAVLALPGIVPTVSCKDPMPACHEISFLLLSNNKKNAFSNFTSIQIKNYIINTHD